jgi:hypothetical protein
MWRLRKTSLTVVSLLFASFLLLSAHTVSAIDDYTVTITNSSINNNQSIIFEEQNIGPGFDESYNIRVNNQSSDSIGVTLSELTEAATNTLTVDDLGMSLSYNGETIAINQNGEIITSGGSICVLPNTSETLLFRVWLDSSLGNDYQDRTFYADITFSANSDQCENSLPPNSGEVLDPNLPELPNTGESRFVVYLLYTLISIFATLSVLFLIIVIVKRKHEDENRAGKKKKVS